MRHVGKGYEQRHSLRNNKDEWHQPTQLRLQAFMESRGMTGDLKMGAQHPVKAVSTRHDGNNVLHCGSCRGPNHPEVWPVLLASLSGDGLVQEDLVRVAHDMAKETPRSLRPVGMLVTSFSRRVEILETSTRRPSRMDVKRPPAARAPNPRRTWLSMLIRVGAYLLIPKVVRLSHHPCLHSPQRCLLTVHTSAASSLGCRCLWKIAVCMEICRWFLEKAIQDSSHSA